MRGNQRQRTLSPLGENSNGKEDNCRSPTETEGAESSSSLETHSINHVFLTEGIPHGCSTYKLTALIANLDSNVP